MSLSAIAELVEGLEIGPDPDDIRFGYRIRDRIDACLTIALGEFDHAGLYDLDVDLTTQAWLGHHLGVAPVAAKRDTNRAKKLRSLPVLREAFCDGRLTGGQIDVIVALLPARHVERFASHEPVLVPQWEDLTIAQTAAVMRLWVTRADALDPGPEPTEQDNQVSFSTTIGGRGELRGSLDPDLTATTEAALREADPGDSELTMPQRRAAAWGTIVEYFLDNHHQPTGRHNRPHVNVVMTAAQFRDGTGGTYLDTGGLVSEADAAMLRCDAIVHRVLVEDRSAVLDFGHGTRTAPADLFNAVLARDQHCRWPGCDRPGSWCHAHHVDWYHRDNGATAIDNLVLLCRRHHRKLHRDHRWRLKLLPDGTLEVTDPGGAVETTTPWGPIPPPLWRTADGG